MSEYMWVGSDGGWNDSSHWKNVATQKTGMGIPGDGDTAIIDPGHDCTVTIDTYAHCASLELGGGGGAQTLQIPNANAGESLTLHGQGVTSTISSNCVLSLPAGSLYFAGSDHTLSVWGTLGLGNARIVGQATGTTIHIETFGWFTNFGLSTHPPGAVIGQINNMSVQNDGSVFLEGPASGGELQLDGTNFVNSPGSQFLSEDDAGPFTLNLISGAVFQNAGDMWIGKLAQGITVTNSAGIGSTPLCTFSNSGTIQVMSGQLKFDLTDATVHPGLVSSGTIGVENGATLTFAGTAPCTFSGCTFAPDASSTIAFASGPAFIFDGCTWGGAGVIELTDNVNATFSGVHDGPNQLNIDASATAQINFSFATFNNTIAWSAGTLQGTSLTISQSGSLKVQSGQTKSLNIHSVYNNGVLNVLDGFTSQCTINNQANGKLSIALTGLATITGFLIVNNGGDFNLAGSGNLMINNSGQFILQGAALITGTPFTNTGDVWLAGYVLQVSPTLMGYLPDVYSQTSGNTHLQGGEIEVPPGKNIAIKGGAIYGSGQLTGNVTVSGTSSKKPTKISPANAKHQVGTLDINGDYTQGQHVQLDVYSVDNPAQAGSLPLLSRINVSQMAPNQVTLDGGLKVHLLFRDPTVGPLEVIHHAHAGWTTGTFSGLPEAKRIKLTQPKGGDWVYMRISYVGGSGHDVTLSW